MSKLVQSQLEKAKKEMESARKAGADIERTNGLFSSAERLVQSGDDEGAKKVIKELKEAVKNAKKKRRLEMMIFNTLPTIEKAKRWVQI